VINQSFSAPGATRHVCESLCGLAQHITHWPACRQKSLPILDGISIQKPTVHQSFVLLDAPFADEAMEPIWQQNDDPDTFGAPQPCSDAAHINCDSETLQFVSNQQNQLDNHIPHRVWTSMNLCRLGKWYKRTCSNESNSSQLRQWRQNECSIYLIS
jgi:hypothetical protein